MEPLPTNKRAYYRERVSVKLRTTIKRKGKTVLKKCYPEFNNDGLPYTPTFLLSTDEEAYHIMDEMLKNQYIEKLKNS